MRRILQIALLLAFSFGLAQETQEIYQRAKINYNSIEDLSALDALGIAVDHGVHKRGFFIISDFSKSEIAAARNAGFMIDIIREDSKAYFLEQNRINAPAQNNPTCPGSGFVDYETPSNFQLGSMGGYLTYQEMLDNLDLMQSLYPNLISGKENIGSFLTNGQADNSTSPSIGGNGIKWVKISDNPNTSENEPQILYTAIHHAREPAGLSQLIFYMWYLLENYDSDPEVKSILDNTELYFVPVINPDGYLYNEKTDPNGGGFWRKNRFNGQGVDLNRNYDYFINGNSADGVWGGEGASGDPGSQTYHGAGPFSEVEAQAMKYFVENHEFVMAFNNHTYGDLLLYPYGYTSSTTTPENDIFQGISDELVSQNGFNNILSSELYPAAGDSDDFMYGTVLTHDKIYAFTPEIGSEFWPPSNEIEGICKSMMYLNLTASKMVNNYASVKDTAPTYVGELNTVNTSFDVKRLGLAGNGDFTIRINPISSNITAVGNPISYNGLQILEETDGVIQYTLSSTIEIGDDISFQLIVNNGSFDTTTGITKKFGSPEAIFEDAGNSVSDNFVNNGWGTTSATFVSPSSSITESPNGNYPNNTNETITLESPIDLGSAIGANVTFYAKWEIENNWDYTQFEVSIDNGANWIPQCGKYTNEGSSNSGQPTGEPLYDGTQNDWVLETIDLSDYLGENILVRFQFEADGAVRADGFYFDDLKINIVSENLSVDKAEINFFSIYPNPVQNYLNITTSLIDYKIEVYSMQGQLITLMEANKGSQTIDYSAYASGLYLMKLTSSSATQTFKIIKK